MDFFADNTMKYVIRELTEENELSRPTWNYWKTVTGRMLRYMSVNEIVNMVLNIAEGISDAEWNNGYPSELFKEEIEMPKIKNSKKKSEIGNKINQQLSILEVAKRFGLIVRNNKCKCPFHNDTDPSLTFYPKTNSWYCWGACKKGGDVIEFYRRLKERDEQKTS